MYMGDTHIVS